MANFINNGNGNFNGGNGFNNGFNNTINGTSVNNAGYGFVNNINQGGNGNNMGYRPPVQNFNAESVIQEIDTAIMSLMQGRVGNIMYVRDTLLRLQKEGKIQIVGGGQNRVAIALVADDSRLRQMYNMNGPMILMVPVKLPEGIRDNHRAAQGYIKVANSGLDQSPEMGLIRNVYLPSYMLPNSYLLVQKRAIRIEDCDGVKKLIASGKYDPNKQLALACRDYIITNQNIYNQYVSLINAFDKYFVMADLDVEFSPWNFGFIMNNNGQEVLTIIDYGYMTHREFPLNCPVCGQPLHYCIPGEEFLKNKAVSALSVSVDTFGQYSCKNMSCNGGKGNGTNVPYYKPDIEVFMDYAETYGKI